MAATQGKGGFGTLLQVGDGGGPETFSTVAEIVDVVPGDVSLETADATHMESPSGFRERVATLLDSGPVTARLNWIGGDSTQAGLRTDQTAKTLRNFKIVAPGAAYEWTFSAFVTRIGDATPMGDVIRIDVELTPSGVKSHGAVS
jgi:hypothetical protein